MSILSRAQQKYIEKKIREYNQMKSDIADWKNSVMFDSSPPEVITRHHSHADPTGAKAEKLLNPPKRIRECQAWIEAIDYVKNQLDGKYSKVLFDKWFWARPMGPDKASRELHISRTTFFMWREEISLRVAIQAEKRGVFVA